MTNKEKIKQSLTFQDIKHNYFKYGYLTDAEVEWLIERVGAFTSVMQQLKKDKYRKTKDGIIRFSMTEEFFKEMVDWL